MPLTLPVNWQDYPATTTPLNAANLLADFNATYTQALSGAATAAAAAYIPLGQKGTVNGVAPLDSAGLLSADDLAIGTAAPNTILYGNRVWGTPPDNSVYLNQQSASYTIQPSDATQITNGRYMVLNMTNATAAIVTVPANLLTLAGRMRVIRSGAGSVTFAAGAGVTINAAGGLLAITNQFDAAELIYVGGNAWVLDGDLTATGTASTAPTVTTGAATNLTSTTATISGTVNPNAAATTYQFQYGTTTGYGSVSPGSATSAGSGSAAVSETANLTGLSPSTTYHYRLNATNATGTTNGPDAAFTTASTAQTLMGFTGTPATGTAAAAPAGEVDAVMFTATASGTATQINLGLSGTANTGVTSVIMGIYANNAGVPGTRLATATVTGEPAPSTTLVAPINLSITAGTSYWVAWLPIGGTLHWLSDVTGSINTRWTSTGNTSLPTTFTSVGSATLAAINVTVKGTVTSSGDVIQAISPATWGNFLTYMRDETIDVIELANGTYTSGAVINVSRTNPITVRPAAGATPTWTSGTFLFGNGGFAKNITMQGMRLNNYAIGSTGIFWLGNCTDITLNSMTVTGITSSTVTYQSFALYCSWDAGIPPQRVRADGWTVTGSGTRSFSAFQAVHAAGNSFTASNWTVDNVGYAIYITDNWTNVTLNNWTINNAGVSAGTPSSVFIGGATGTYSNVHITNSITARWGTMTDGGGNTFT
jgi:hypothetical protein